MTALDRMPAPSLPWQLRQAGLLAWRELPSLLAVGALLLATAAPAVVAALAAAPWWLVAAAALAPTLVLTGAASVAADLADGGRVRLRRLAAVDPVLALALVIAATAVAMLLAAGERSPGALVAGCLLAAVGGLIAGPALAYGAVRGRRGLAAIRGGAVLAIWRPGSALTLLSLAAISGFAVAATAGVLALVLPAVLLVFAALVTASQLAEHDGAAPGGGSR